MSTPTERLAFASEYALIHTAVGGIAGAFLYWLVRANGRPDTPIKLGREFAGFMLLIASLGKGGKAILDPSPNHLAEWAVVAFGFAIIGFICGWGFGKIKQLGTSAYGKAKPHVEARTGVVIPQMSEAGLGKCMAWMAIPAFLINGNFLGGALGTVMLSLTFIIIWLGLSYAMFWWRASRAEAGHGRPIAAHTASLHDAVWACTKCQTVSPVNAKYCGNCGTELERTPTCARCNSPIRDHEKFCGNCGNKLS